MNSIRRASASQRSHEKADGGFAFAMLLIYMVSFLLHIPSRIPVLAILRPDMILLGLLAFSLVSSNWKRVTDQKLGRILIVFCLWVLLTVPFVEWPGSIIRETWKPFAKATIFFFAIVLSVTNERKLIKFLTVFLICQVTRLLEPLYLHVTTGFWGDYAHIGGGEWFSRLSGAPSDVVNPNGLAFVAIIVFPFLHQLMWKSNKKIAKIFYVVLMPTIIYVLLLTGSRSGLIGFGIALMGLIYFSEKRTLAVVVVCISTVFFALQLDDGQQDRFRSLVDSDTRNASTAEGRVSAWGNELRVGLENPVFGHGVGTSKEALFNSMGGHTGVSHNVYTEALIDMGLVGLVIFLMAIVHGFRLSIGLLRGMEIDGKADSERRPPPLRVRLAQALAITYFAWVVFHMAQYGVSEYHWYVLFGLTIASIQIYQPIESGEKTIAQKNLVRVR